MPPYTARDLRAVLSPGATITAAPEFCARYMRDRGYSGTPPDLVLKPGTLQDIAVAVAWAYTQRLPIIPRGLATTAHGESISAAGGLLIDLSQFNRIGAVSPDTGTVTVAAGASWGMLSAQLDAQGYKLYTYPASRFSTVGGWISTGGLGINAFGYGHLSRWVEALNLITGTGETRILVPRDKAFEAVFGAEGRMGIIAEVTLRVRPVPNFSRAHLFYFDTTRALFVFVRHLIDSDAHLAHLALYDPGYMEYLNRHYDEVHPDRTSFYEPRPAALVHVDSEVEERALEDALAHADFLVEQAPTYAAAALWQRRFYPFVIKRYGPDVLEAPVTLPLDAAPDFLEEVIDRAVHFGLRPAVVTTVVPARVGNAQDLAMIMPRIPYDARSRARPFYTLLAHLITHGAVQRGGAPYASGHVNAPFADVREQHIAVHRRAADPVGLFNPRPVRGLVQRMFRPVLGLAHTFAGQIGQLARIRHQTGPLGLPPRPTYEENSTLTDSELATTIDACTNCGNCVVVCPAFLLTRDEASTGRTKLKTGRSLLAGAEIDIGRAEATFMCTYCGACQEVCETELPLLAAYATIERKLSKRYSTPQEAISRFVESVETDPAYMRFVGLEAHLPEPPRIAETGEITPPRRDPIGPYRVSRFTHCINCGRCAMVCPTGVHARRLDDPRRLAGPVSNRCIACMRCVQICPVRALTVAPSSGYARLGQGIYTPDIIYLLSRQAGGIEELHMQLALDRSWLDLSPIVYPPLPSEEVDVSVALGRRLERLQFDASGVTSMMPPVVELGLPLMLALPESAPDDLSGALRDAARALETLALVDGPAGPETALRIRRGRWVDSLPVDDLRLLVIDPADEAIIPRLRTRYRSLAIGVEIRLDRNAPDDALAWVSRDAHVLILNGPDALSPAGETVHDTLALLSDVHQTLVEHARRDRVSLVLRGSVATARHLVAAMLYGADAVIIDWPLLMGLECRLQGDCTTGEHRCGLDRVDPEWAAARMANLVRAWEAELRAVLVGLGLRCAHELRDASDRVRFDPDSDRTGLAVLRYLSPADQALVQLLGH